MAIHKTAARAPRKRAHEPGKLEVSDDVVEQLQKRLRRIEGQVAAIHRMVGERRDCHAIAMQMSAARAALGRAFAQLMATSMAQCARPNGSGDDTQLAHLTETFIKLMA